ncbi:MAG: hypothetical protein ACK559_08800, partial [bacterium]
VTVAVLTTDTAASIATKVQAALVKDGTAGSGRYSTPEVQMITFLSKASGAGNINVNSTSVAIALNDTPATIGGKVVTALNAVVGRNYFATQDGDSVRVTFDNAAGDFALMSGLTIP